MGGIAHAEMMGRTNLVALVAGGAAPRFPDRNGQSASVKCSFCRDQAIVHALGDFHFYTEIYIHVHVWLFAAKGVVVH